MKSVLSHFNELWLLEKHIFFPIFFQGSHGVSSLVPNRNKIQPFLSTTGDFLLYKALIEMYSGKKKNL